MRRHDPISDPQRRVLLGVAVDVIADVLVAREPRFPEPAAFRGALAAPGASFVTLERGEDLLGCIGSMVPTQPLVADVARHALDAAFADPRLPAVTRDDFEYMTIKVSVLSTPEPLPANTFRDVAAQVRPGVDGVLVASRDRGATLLPSVWTHSPDVETFLAALWHKARLAPGSWPTGTVVSRYTTEEFGDTGPRSLAVASP